MKRAAVAALALLAAGCTSTIAGTAGPSSQPANLAYVDPNATRAATDGVTKALETVFSFDSTDQASVTKNEQEYFTGAAREQFDKTMSQIKGTSVTTQTHVVDSGVATLSPHGATVLAAVKQQSRAADGQTSAALAIVLVTAAPAGNHWQVSNLDLNPRGTLAAADAPGSSRAAATRDSALTAAHTAGAKLLTVDAQNPDAVYDGYESVATDPLLSQFRATRQLTVAGMKSSGAKASLKPDSAAVVTSAAPDGKTATVLLDAIVTTRQQGGPQDKTIPVRLTLARQADGSWKVSGIESLNYA